MTKHDKPKFVTDLPPQDGADTRSDIMEGRTALELVADTAANLGMVVRESLRLTVGALGKKALLAASGAYAAPHHVAELVKKTGEGYVEFEYGNEPEICPRKLANFEHIQGFSLEKVKPDERVLCNPEHCNGPVRKGVIVGQKQCPMPDNA